MTVADPTLAQTAQIVSVYEVQAGSSLAADMVAGATTLTVEDLDDFSDAGGSLYVAALDNADSTTQPVAYSGVDRTAGTILLAAVWDPTFPLFVAGDQVWAYPNSSERRADVALDGETDQIVVARIPFGLSANLPVGVREPNGGEWIRVELDGYGYNVADALGDIATTDPGSISITDPDTGDTVGEIGSDAAFHSVTADVITSPTVPYRNFTDQLIYVDAANGNDSNDGTAIPGFLDTFERTVSGALGTSDSGHAWTTVVNTGNLLDVNSGSARFRSNAASAVINVRNAFAALDIELSGVFNMGAILPTPNAFAFGFMARMIGTTDGYWVGLTLLATGQLRIDGNSKIAGTQAGMPGASYSLGTFTGAALGAIDWNVRTQFQLNAEGGTDIRAKAWKTTDPEPEAWQWEVNDQTAAAAQVPGAVGLEYRSGSGVTTSSILYCRSAVAFCIDAGGLPIDTTTGAVGPLQTVNAALARAGDWNDAIVRIVLSGTIEEAISIRGLGGGGQLIIDGANAGTLWGTVEIFGAIQRVLSIRNLTIQDTGDGVMTGTITVRASTYVEITGCAMQANGRAANIQAFDGSMGVVSATTMGGAAARCLYVANSSTWYANANSGSAGEAYRCSVATLFWISPRPTGTLTPVNSGQILPASGGTTSGGSPPPSNPKKTKTVQADSTLTYRPQWGWRDDNDEAYQGEWQGSGGLSRGCAFYGTKLQVASKTADSGKIWIQRLSSGGASQGQAIWLASHSYGTRPGGNPAIVDGPINLGNLAWGQAKWFSIPTSWVQKMLNGTVQGVMLYHGSASPYVICAGRKNSGANFKISLTYH